MIKAIAHICIGITFNSILMLNVIGQINADSIKLVFHQETTFDEQLSALDILIPFYIDNDPDSAIVYCDIYNQIANASKNQNSIAESYLFYATHYSVEGNYQQLASYAYPALDLFKSENNARGQIDVLVLLGRMNGAKEEFDKAYENYEEATELAKSSKDFESLVTVNIGISNTKFLQEKLEESEKYLLENLTIIKEHSIADSAELLAKIYTNLGNVNSAKLNDLNAIKYYKKSNQYYRKTQDKFGISLTAFNIGDVYNYNDMYDSALKYFNITLDMGNELHNYVELYYANLGFTEVYERKGDFEKANAYLKIKHAYADSIKQQKYNEGVVELEKKYNSEKKVAELKAKETEIAQAKEKEEQDGMLIQILAIGGGILAALSVGLLIMYKRVSKANNLIKEQSISLDQTVKQKEILLQEVHHRVKNNLQLIASLLNLQLMNLEDPLASKAIEDSKSRVQAIALMHKGLYQDENYSSANLKSYVTELVDNLKAFSSTQTLDLTFDVNVDPIEVEIDKSVPVGLILSELINNSLKHAFKHTDSGKIEITIQQDGDKISLCYKDNGAGLPMDFKLDEQESLGFTIITSLSEQIGGKISIDSYSPFELSLRF